jgi:deoxyribose-phosphate aldolase
MTTPIAEEARTATYEKKSRAKVIYDAQAVADAALASPQSLAAAIDHTLLRPEASRAQVLQLCSEAAQYRFACAMVNPIWVATAHAALVGTGVPVGAAIGFPLGASLTITKREEAEAMIKAGARELDIMLNLGLLKSGETALVEADIRGVVEIAHDAGAIVKVILETCLLSLEEKLLASEIACTAGTDFLKTSTGFSATGATTGDVALLRGVAGSRCGVKASGGIRTLAEARAMLEAGADRLGSSSSVTIVKALEDEIQR